MKLKLIFALLSLALYSDALAARSAHMPSLHVAHLNETNRGDGVMRVPAQQKGKRKRARRTGVKVDGADKLPAPVVTEIDGDGLRKLLQRGEGEAARPLLVNFWATWCGPCRAEFPDLVKLEAEYRGCGLEVALVSADDVEELKTGVPVFLWVMRANAIPAYLLNATDTEGALALLDPHWGGELPATFLFDRHGALVYKHTGIIDPAKLRDALNKALSVK